MNNLITDLNEGGWKLYLNANNCGFCHRQLAFFGSKFHEINKIHCDDNANSAECSKYKALPVWVNVSSEVYSGARLTFEAFDKMLAQVSG
jgi:cytochrome c peroxidase